jgi:hypothetical protein
MTVTAAAHYYRAIEFRAGVECIVGDTRAVFTYDLVTFDVDLNDAAAAEVDRLCADLRAGLPTDTVSDRYAEFAPYVWELIDVFDRYGFITEAAHVDDHDAIPGHLFWRQVDAFASRAKLFFGPVLYGALVDRTASRQSLITYAREYFHLVSAGPRIIAGALPHEHDPVTRRLLETFVCQEVGHDRLLLRSLAAVGIDEDEAQNSLPLPETFALISGLQTLADQDPLSFKSLVFLLEEATPDFHEALVSACRDRGLDRSFWGPIIDHADINDEGDHGSISERLLARIELVSAEQRTVVLKNVATMIESLVAFEKAVLRAGAAPDGR